MTANELNELKKEYDETEIPPELASVVRRTLRKRRVSFAGAVRCAASVAASVAILFCIAVNVSPAFAESCENMPVIGYIARIINVKTYSEGDENYQIDINIPEISGLANTELQRIINEELRSEGEMLYESMKRDIDELKTALGEGAHLSFATYFDIMTSNEFIFSLKITYYYGAGSSNTSYRFYNVDQKTGRLLTLSDLFKSDSGWLDIINAYLLDQMQSEVYDDSGKSIYWVNEDDISEWRFNGITAGHNFYINSAGHLCIAFDKYEVAPGAVGTPEFEIPTRLLEDCLAENSPLK